MRKTFIGVQMKNEHFYFLTDDYCNRYEKYGVMRNKEVMNGIAHNRPCFMRYKIMKRSRDTEI